MSPTTLTSYKKTRAAFKCARCGVNQDKPAQPVQVFTGSEPICPKCQTPHQRAMAASIGGAPKTALCMLTPTASEIAGQTPKKLMAAKGQA